MAELTGTTFWDRLTPDVRAEVTAAAVPRTADAGQALFREGDPSRDVFIVTTGLVKVSKLALDGREVILELRGAGEILGEMAAIDAAPRSATGVCLETTDVLVLSTTTFNHLVDTRAAVGSATLRTVVGRLREAADRQLEFGTSDALGRVCRRLVELARQNGATLDGPDVHLPSPVSQHELAEWAGLSRDAVVRSLKTLRDLGWVETGRQQFHLLDPAAIVDRAGATL